MSRLSDTPPDALASTERPADARAGGLRRPPSLGCLTAAIAGGACLALLAGLLVVTTVWQSGERRVIDAERARLREAGLPLTPAEVDAYYTLDPDRPDATSAWLDAIAACDSEAAKAAYVALTVGPTGQDYLQFGEVPTDRFRTFVADQAETYAAIDRAVAAGSNVRYPGDLSVGFGMTLDSASGVREVMRWLDARLVLALREDRLDDAIKHLEAFVTTGDTLAREPLLISQAMRTAVHSVALGRLKDLLAGERPTEAQLDRIAAFVAAIPDRRGYARAIAGERGLMIDLLAGRAGPVATGDAGLDRFVGVYQTTPLVARDERLMLEIYRDLDAALDAETVPVLLERYEAVSARIERLWAESTIPPYAARAFTPGVELTGRIIARTEAEAAMLGVAVAARRHALRTGRFPRSAAELAAELPDGRPVDPFDGKPLRLAFVDDATKLPGADPAWEPISPGPGLLIYSVGADRADDGGVFDPAGGTPGGAEGDLLFFLPETPDPTRVGPPHRRAGAESPDANTREPPRGGLGESGRPALTGARS